MACSRRFTRCRSLTSRYVQRLEVEYHFGTWLEPQKIEDAGDIAVLRGTDVQLRVFPTMKTAGGRIMR